MRYNITCSSCGKPQHHKQIKFDEIFVQATQSALLGFQKRFRVRICNVCLASVVKLLINHLDQSTFNRFIERNGEKQ